MITINRKYNYKTDGDCFILKHVKINAYEYIKKNNNNILNLIDKNGVEIDNQQAKNLKRPYISLIFFEKVLDVPVYYYRSYGNNKVKIEIIHKRNLIGTYNVKKKDVRLRDLYNIIPKTKKKTIVLAFGTASYNITENLINIKIYVK